MSDRSLQLHYGDQEWIWDQQFIVKTLKEAATTFVHEKDGEMEIWAAARDWFLEEWGRDTFIALPGILLTTERYDDAAAVFRHFARFESNGLLPNRIREGNIEYNTADGSMWYIYALQQYVQCTDDWALVEELFPVLQKVMQGYEHGTFYERGGERLEIKMDTDGLILSPKQATWMDADPSENNSQIVTPRDGKAVEICSLWYANLVWMQEVCQQFDADGSHYNQLADTTRASFQAKFWNAEKGCLFDVLDGDPKGDAIRPNQILTLSVAKELLTTEQQESILHVVTRDLLTPGGLRTLSPDDPDYIGTYNTDAPMSVKDLAYHQGTAWPWLMGPYCDALAALNRVDEIKGVLMPLARFCTESPYKSIPEVFSGDRPHQQGGTTSQAWSVAEVLRVIDKYL